MYSSTRYLDLEYSTSKKSEIDTVSISILYSSTRVLLSISWLLCATIDSIVIDMSLQETKNLNPTFVAGNLLLNLSNSTDRSNFNPLEFIVWLVRDSKMGHQNRGIGNKSGVLEFNKRSVSTGGLTVDSSVEGQKSCPV